MHRPSNDRNLPAHRQVKFFNQRWDGWIQPANRSLQLFRGSRYLAKADVSRDTGHRVSDSFGQLPVLILECSCDLRACIGLLRSEAQEQVAEEPLVPRNAPEASGHVNAFHLR
jgi:hypothetical protein